MNKKVFILWTLISLLTIIIFSLLLFKIDYYKTLNYQIVDNGIIFKCDYSIKTIYINDNHNLTIRNDFQYLKNDLYFIKYVTDKYKVNKISVYILESRMNYLSYIFKVIFNI